MVTACEGPSVIIEHQTIVITEPEIYQHCLTEPTPPPVGASNKAWKDYHLAMKEYGNDCEGKVVGGREWLKKNALPQLPVDSEAESYNPEEDQTDQKSLWDKLWNNRSTPPERDR
jgi:hypothetical protein